jgi:glycosyl transferase family 25
MEFPPILVINLPERTDRWSVLQNTLDSTGLSYERVNAIKRTPGWKGCSLSHRRCVEIAKERRWPWVLILEDDCRLLPKWQEEFTHILPSLWQKKDTWELFNGGPSTLLQSHCISLSPPLFSVKAYGTHFILLHCGSYDKVLRDVGDHLRIDVYYTESMKTLCTVPHLATQQTTYSDIERKVLDYSHNFQKTENKLTRQRNEVEHRTTDKIVTFVLVTLLALTLIARK